MKASGEVGLPTFRQAQTGQNVTDTDISACPRHEYSKNGRCLLKIRHAASSCSMQAYAAGTGPPTQAPSQPAQRLQNYSRVICPAVPCNTSRLGASSSTMAANAAHTHAPQQQARIMQTTARRGAFQPPGRHSAHRPFHIRQPQRAEAPGGDARRRTQSAGSQPPAAVHRTRSKQQSTACVMPAIGFEDKRRFSM